MKHLGENSPKVLQTRAKGFLLASVPYLVRPPLPASLCVQAFYKPESSTTTATTKQNGPKPGGVLTSPH